jgi:hypothetical protein
MQGTCRASLDSLMNAQDFGPSLRSRGLLLQSAATAQSTMDFSTMAVDDGVVDSPVTRSSRPEILTSLSPTWPPSKIEKVSADRMGCTFAKRALYGSGEDVALGPPVKVSFYFPSHVMSVIL